LLRAALTGGIAAGKSAALKHFADLGACVTDADELARVVVEPGSAGLAQVVAAFGDGVLTATGQLDRPALGQLVFADPAARRRLEGIIHPLIQTRSQQLEAEAQAAGVAVVVHDIPLLAEGGRAGEFDRVVVVDTPLALRRQRAIEDRGMRPEDFDSRVKAQASQAERLAIATDVLDGSGTRGELRQQVEALYNHWLSTCT